MSDVYNCLGIIINRRKYNVIEISNQINQIIYFKIIYLSFVTLFTTFSQLPIILSHSFTTVFRLRLRWTRFLSGPLWTNFINNWIYFIHMVAIYPIHTKFISKFRPPFVGTGDYSRQQRFFSLILSSPPWFLPLPQQSLIADLHCLFHRLWVPLKHQIRAIPKRNIKHQNW